MVNELEDYENSTYDNIFESMFKFIQQANNKHVSISLKKFDDIFSTKMRKDTILIFFSCAFHETFYLFFKFYSHICQNNLINLSFRLIVREHNETNENK